MWIRGVDVPEAVINAHRAGGLVLFVGAGASRSSPSDLPDFRSLTADIAAESSVPVVDAQLDQPDQLLGDLAEQHHVDVHARVAARLGVSSSQPNRLHAEIARLASSVGPIRIVTTNYDLHLSSALAAAGSPSTEYMAPALPMGDDFTGIVYLHGCLQQEPAALIVTDADFGRAYLRDAWAARFLERMFSRFTVLFVGYSHGDVVMSYLARGLGRTSPRYALTPDPNAPHWRRLRIEPIGYPVAAGSHEALVEVVEGWASWAAMGLLDHRQQVARLVASAPSPVPDEASYLEAVVADPEKVVFFAEHARGEAWLAWAATQPEFQKLFDPSAAATGCAGTLAYWFAQHCVIVDDLSEAALRVVRDAGGRLGPTAWSAIGHVLHARDAPRPAWLGPWLVLLVQDAPEAAGGWLDYALRASRWPDDRAAALLLFDRLTEPQAVFLASFGLVGGPRFDVRLRGEDYWLREAWDALFAPNLAEVVHDVLVIVDRHLRRAHQLLSAAGSAGPGWDPLSFSRSAIEPHSQDDLPYPADILIDAARDCLETLLTTGPDVGAPYLDAWAASDVPLLRRLALHGWIHRRDVDATAKINWLRERGWLFDHQLRHEVFRLIEATIADAATDAADALVADAAGAPADLGDHGAYESYNALMWIVRHAPAVQSARDALDRVTAEHPEFGERPHPDLLAWSESGAVSPQPPMRPEELHQLIGGSAEEANTELLRYEDRTSPFDGPTWSDALGVLEATVQEWPADGFRVLDTAGGNHPEIVGSVIRGWTHSTLDQAGAEAVATRLRDVDLGVVGDDVARLLAEGGHTDSPSTEWHESAAARLLAVDLWNAPGDRAFDIDGDNWLARAINDRWGQIAEFWVQVAAADWRRAGDEWAGLPTNIADQLDVMLDSSDDRAAMAEVILASQLHFFFRADRGWCERRLLPLLSWEHPERALRTWSGFLSWGRWDDQLLSAGLLEHYLATAVHIGELREDLRRQFCQHLAAVALYSDINPVDSEWARNFTATVDEGIRSSWLKQVGWLLGKLPAEAADHQWTRWMRRYWQDRLAGIPVLMTFEEASTMAEWVAYLRSSVEDGVALATSHPAGVLEHSTLLHDLTQERVALAPAAIATLLAHLLVGTSPPFYGCYQLADVFRWLRSSPQPPDVQTIVEHATRLGCGDAPSW